LRRRKVDSSTEKRILTALIVSTQFIQEIQDVVNLDYFTNSFIRKAAGWCIDFFQNYESAPFDHIQDIFRTHRKELKDDEADLIEKLLTDISKKYELDQGLNVPYMVDQALFFFKKRELEITNGNISILLDRNDIDGAEAQINSFAKISRVASGWVDALDPRYIDEVFQHQDRMFTFSGELGKFLKGFDRSWLVAIAGAYKRGKTLHLLGITIGAMQQRLRVAWFSLEMGRRESNDRLYKGILGAGSSDGGPALYPCFDCVYNQDGSCKKAERTNRLPLLKGDRKPQFSPNLRYTPCTVCRFENPKEYGVAWWYTLIDRPAYTEHNVKKQLTAIKRAWPNSYRFKSYPKFSATLSDMKRDLDVLERTDGFIPDIIIVDQANGVKPESGISLDGIAPHAATWRGLASLAGERCAMVVSPTQITRAALEKKNIKQSDIASHIGLLGDVDVAYSINQTEEEKIEGVMQYSIMAHRHEEFDTNAVCIVLQKMRFGQVYLDAHIISRGWESQNIYTV